MATTFVKIQTVTVGTAVATIDFTSIPQTYTDLAVQFSSRTSRSDAQANVGIRFNSSLLNLNSRILRGLNTAPDSYTSATEIEFSSTGNTATASVFGSAFIYITNYTSSNNKSVSLESAGETNSANAFISITAGLWSNSAAMTTVTLYTRDAATTFNQYTTATLYGIKSS